MLLFTLINLFLWTRITLSLTLPNTLSQSDIDALLAAHNDVRSEVSKGNRAGYQSTLPKATDMIRIEWDEALAKVASDYAATCPTGHSDKTSRKNALSDAINIDCLSNIDYNGNDGIGENMGWTSQNPSISILTGSIDSMNDESDWYQYGNKFGDSTNNYYESLTPPQTPPYPNANDFCLYPDSTNGGSCGHFTQNIWATTRYVGCGFAQCDFPGYNTGTRLVCNYYDAGNYAEQAVYTEGTTSCSNCPVGSTCDSDKLCSYPPSPSPTCKPTQSPLPPTVTPDGPPACMQLSDYAFSSRNGVYIRNGGSDAQPIYMKDDSAYRMEWNSYDFGGGQGIGYAIFTGTSNSLAGYCDQTDITNCGANTWFYYDGGDPLFVGDSDATFTATTCPANGIVNGRETIETPLISEGAEDTASVPNTSPMVVNEMHIILILLVFVSVTICAMITIGICCYIKKNKKNDQLLQDVDNKKDEEGDDVEMDPVYFANADIEHSTTQCVGTPIGENNGNKPSLIICIEDKKGSGMKRLSQTTPVTPLMDDGPFDAM